VDRKNGTEYGRGGIMPKLILEKCDIEKLIKEKYKDCEVVSGLAEDTEIIVRIDMLDTHTTLPPVVIPEATKKPEGPRKHTIPGSTMGLQRGRLPTF